VEKLCRTGKIQIDGFEENGSCYYFHFDNEWNVNKYDWYINFKRDSSYVNDLDKYFWQKSYVEETI
jgi:isochorismate hydrolase